MKQKIKALADALELLDAAGAAAVKTALQAFDDDILLRLLAGVREEVAFRRQLAEAAAAKWRVS